MEARRTFVQKSHCAGSRVRSECCSGVNLDPICKGRLGCKEPRVESRQVSLLVFSLPIFLQKLSNSDCHAPQGRSRPPRWAYCWPTFVRLPTTHSSQSKHTHSVFRLSQMPAEPAARRIVRETLTRRRIVEETPSRSRGAAPLLHLHAPLHSLADGDPRCKRVE